MLFLLLPSFTLGHAILDCLSSTESLILLVLFCMYSIFFSFFFFFFFWYMLANSFCTFSSFRALILVRFFLLHLEAVFTSARFFLMAKVSRGTLGLALCLVGIYTAAASQWALMKSSYLSLEVCVSVFSCSASNLFLSVNVYLSLISLLLSRDQSQCTVVVVRVVFVRWLSRIFAVTIRWSEDTPSKEKYATQFNALLFHFLLIKT